MIARMIAVAAVATLALSGCSAMPYYWQAANGQLDLWRRSRPIDQWLADPVADESLKARLTEVQRIRDFATRNLGLPNNGSYRSYADLGRPYVAWNAFAAPELSLEAKEWCFPIAGCVTYRGYFSEREAREFTSELAGEGYDTYVGGVPAYSTLGWFDDPVPSTIVEYPDTEVARLIFHELAHQVVYVKDDTTFNESFATTVEQEGVRRWVTAQNAPGKLAQFEQSNAERRQFVDLVLKYRDRLEEIYALPSADSEKRAEKARTIAAMRAEYAEVKGRAGGVGRYEFWFAGPVNNAQIVSVASYTQQVPAFLALLAQENGDMKRFYAAAKVLAELPKAERHAKLEGLGEKVTTAAR